MLLDRLRKMSRAILGGSLFLLVSSAASAQPSEPRYVIADQDVSSSADMALSLLLVSPEVRVLGITVVTGDSWRDQEVMHALRLVEGLGRTDVPVIAGAAFPLVRTAQETRLYNRLYGKPFYLGAYTSSETPWAGTESTWLTCVRACPESSPPMKTPRISWCGWCMSIRTR
jgi:purine nucleosidase